MTYNAQFTNDTIILLQTFDMILHIYYHLNVVFIMLFSLSFDYRVTCSNSLQTLPSGLYNIAVQSKTLFKRFAKHALALHGSVLGR